MSKETIKLSIKRVFTDRPFLALIALVIMSGLVYCIVTGFTLQARDVQVYSRYTAFGEVHFYKSPWQYLITLAVFGLVVVAIHVGLMIKLHNLGRRQTAILVGCIAVVLLGIAIAYSLSVMH